MTSEFLTPLRTEKIGDYRWLLIDDLQFRSVEFGAMLTVPRGFQTDLASIPRILWVLFPKVDRWDAAACVHDAGYGHALTVNDERITVTKKQADSLFREGMQALGVNVLQRTIMYWMVRLFGDPLDHPLAEHVPP